MRRRLFLGWGAGIISSVLGYGIWRGLRFPGIGIDPSPQETQITIGNAKIALDNLFLSELQSIFKEDQQTPVLRAVAPEPRLTLQSNSGTQELEFEINNISPLAQISVSNADYEETINGISRLLKITLEKDLKVDIFWQLNKDLRFAVIGDTGGNHELAWCLNRANQLNVLFLLHLGDFNYHEDDYDRAISMFQRAELPVFITIGNHDFHSSGRLVDKFVNYLGPLNNVFNYQGIRFLNLDTAVSLFPANRGDRGRFLNQLKQESDQSSETVVFTHKPLFNPMDDRDAGIEDREQEWLLKQIAPLNINVWLAGHIHILNDSTHDGLRQIIAGQGLGYQDIIHQGDVSRMVVAELNVSGQLEYELEPLQMPLDMHCHPRLLPWKQENAHLPHVNEVLKACEK